MLITLGPVVEELVVFFHERNIKLSASKSMATLLFPWFSEMIPQLNVEVDGHRIPPEVPQDFRDHIRKHLRQIE